jgi:NAD-dependent deacetylase
MLASMSKAPCVEPELERIRRFAALLRGARRAVVFSGAGMSTESGLPDFRSSAGLWKQSRRFEELASVQAFSRDFAEFAEFYRLRIRSLAEARPNAGHALLAAWQKRRLISTLVTQNVDGLHEQAGSEDVLCLHGSLRTVHCQRCGHRTASDRFLEPSGLQCESCQGLMRPSVVLFGEALDPSTLEAAFAASEAADLFVVLGSSLLVSPANLLPRAALHAGASLVLVNQEATPLADVALLDFRAPIGAILTAVAQELG